MSSKHTKLVFDFKPDNIFRYLYRYVHCRCCCVLDVCGSFFPDANGTILFRNLILE